MANSNFNEWWPYLLPVILLQLALTIAALVDLRRCARTRGPRWVWLIVILFVNIFGPLLYFTVGREQ